ncbi:hypothetical protein HMPREF1986_01490 [Oribacterium sp. oral taxon 078 str. F0263]|nr:hypothetical protein HMPREF1986_01490 [Oribacterium sp. oral taxon 078 str. F0263]
MLLRGLLFSVSRESAEPAARAYIEKKRLTMVLCKKDHSEVCSFCAGFRPEKATG